MTEAAGRDGEGTWWVACLCAAWCGVCRDWRPLFEQLARDRPDLRVAWVDVEDEDESMGDIDIETFPTVLVARGDQALFCAPIAPTRKALDHLVNRLQAQGNDAPPGGEIQALLGRLQAEVLPHAVL